MKYLKLFGIFLLILTFSFGTARAATILFPTGGGTGWGSIQTGTLLYGQGTGRLATTTQGIAGQVLSLLNGIPSWTSTTTFSGGLTYSAGNVTNSGVISNVAGTGIGVSGATGAVTISNTGVTSIVAGTNISISGATGAVTINANGGSGTGLSTTTPLNAGDVLTYTKNGAGAAYGTATTSLSVSTGLTSSGTIGSLVGGTTASISFAPIAANSLWVNGTGAAAVPTVIATSSLGLAASITGTQGQNVIIGAAGIPVATSTIFTTTGSAVGINTLTPSAQFDVKGTTTDATAQSADFWNSANTNLLRIRNDGNIGIGSTSPWALLSINANGIPLTSAQFSVGSSTATNLVVANNGFVGVGTSSPVSPLTIVAANPSNLSGLGLYSGASNRFTTFTIGRTAVEFTFAIAAGTNQFVMGAQAGDSLLQGNNNLFINTAALKTQTTGGVFGIGTTTPSALFSAQITPSTQSKIPFLIGSSTANFATTTLFVIDNKGLITSPALGTPAGTFLAADPSGNIIATTTPSGGAGTNFWTSLAGNIYNNTGARVQFPLFDATSTTGTSTITSSLAIGSGVQNTYLSVGTTSSAAGYARNYLADFTGTMNDFVSINVNNNTSGACATADLTATNDVGSISANFADLGHTSSAFTGSGCVNNPFPGFGANSTYLFDPNGNMNFAIASTSDASFRFFTGGYTAANQKLTLTNAGRLGVGTSTPWRTLSVTGTVGFDGLTSGSGTALCLSANKELVTCTASSGTVTSVATNNGITGGTITTTGTIGLAAIAANSVLGNITGASGVPSAVATSSLFAGTTGQGAYFASTGGLVGTSTLFITAGATIGVGTTTTVYGTNSFTQAISNGVTALGGLLINTVTNVTNAFSIFNATGANVFNVDTTASNPFLGVGTSTPYSTISAVGNATNPIFALASTTNSGLPNFSVDKTGIVVTSGVKPVVSSCGTTNSISGNDMEGSIMFTGTLVTTCTMTFATPVPAGQTLGCLVSDNSTTGFSGVTATSTTAVTFGISTGLASGALLYSCHRWQ